ncbi:hypothetical protein EDF77_0388 [Stenotrophomonas maltophilia]|nr:hypothetical protein EDF77_0388 [Stenotrophomonas maltophilia]
MAAIRVMKRIKAGVSVLSLRERTLTPSLGSPPSPHHGHAGRPTGATMDPSKVGRGGLAGR